jgi:hypothetical protein
LRGPISNDEYGAAVKGFPFNLIRRFLTGFSDFSYLNYPLHFCPPS